MQTRPAPAVEFRGICKRFGAVQANRDVSFPIPAGSVHGIIGENGAGKSTLMSLLYGLQVPDAGTMLVSGAPVRFGSCGDAIRSGIGMVHQHFMLVECFTVLENILLGHEGGFLVAQAMAGARQRIEALCTEFGIEVDLDARIEELPVGVQQRVEILKALYRGARVLILDEPTAVLTPAEVDHLAGMVARLRECGTTVILITHKLREIMAMTDEVTVMRAGEVVARRITRETDATELGELMVGRKVSAIDEQVAAGAARGSARSAGKVRLAVQDLSWVDRQGVARVSGVSLELRAGEILGVAGVSGNGQSELMLLLAGMMPPSGGLIRVAAAGGLVREISADRPAGPREMRRLRVAHVPEDRHRIGMVLGFPAWEVACLGYLDDASLRAGPLLRASSMRQMCRELMESFDVRPRNERLGTSKFSGGNQQKLVLAREVRRQPKVLLVGQPTRGVDIGAIELIYERLRALRDQGCAILLVSSELDEILALSDRVAVMSGGRVTGLLPRAEADARRLGELMGDGARCAA